MRPFEFLQKWAYLGRRNETYKKACEKIKKFKHYSDLDVENYIEHLFVNVMFLLNNPDDIGYAKELPSEEISPLLWGANSKYVARISYEGIDYAIINTGLYDESTSDLYLIFRKNKSGSSSPWLLESISSCNENSGIILRDEDVRLEKIDYFSKKEYIIFKKENLRNWNNPETSYINFEHIKDRKIRLPNNISILEEEEIRDIIQKGIKEACLHTERNYKYAAPYVYFDEKDNCLSRGFLLPIKYGKEIICVAAVTIRERTEKGGNYKIHYTINTLLTLEQARKNASLICLPEENWLLKK